MNMIRKMTITMIMMINMMIKIKVIMSLNNSIKMNMKKIYRKETNKFKIVIIIIINNKINKLLKNNNNNNRNLRYQTNRNNSNLHNNHINSNNHNNNHNNKEGSIHIIIIDKIILINYLLINKDYIKTPRIGMEEEAEEVEGMDKE